MRDNQKFYIEGKWVEPTGTRTFDVVNPATEEVAGVIRFASQADVDRAVAAARKAFETYSQTTREERIALLRRIAAEFETRTADLAAAITEEMGCPSWLAKEGQIGLGAGHVHTTIEVLKNYEFDRMIGTTMVRKTPIGVCALISAWNFPLGSLMPKLVPVLATGCTAVAKPSEFAPFSSQILAEILDAAGVPPGVFNLVYGEGPIVGAALSAHTDVDMVSITGSVRAGVEVARNAAATVKRVHQELGGKSPNILLPDADLAKAIDSSVRFMMINSGQVCAAPSRMLVPRARAGEAAALAKATAEDLSVGPPQNDVYMGPVVNEAQWNRIQGYIQKGLDEGARLVTGGLGKPQGLERGYYVKPTIFADVTPDMTIAQEEIFGPVMTILSYDSTEEAIRIANGTKYGLAGYVHAGSLDEARKVAARLRGGQIFINGGMELFDLKVPFGGCKMSGNGREWGEWGLETCLEDVALVGYAPLP